jgi:two-component system, cell cycle sensor histidine kinase and response regulator CckA
MAPVENITASPPVESRPVQDIATRDRLLFDLAPDAIFVEDEHGAVLDVNFAACELHGMTREELLAKNVRDLVPVRLRDEVSRAFPLWTTGELLRVEGVSLAKGGREIPVEISGRRIDYGGRAAVLFQVRDISARHRMVDELSQAKELVENLIRTANILIVGLDVEGAVGMINEAAARILGWSQEEIAGRDWFGTLLPKERHPDAWRAFLAIRDAGNDTPVETEMVSKSGARCVIAWRFSRILKNGAVASIAMFGLDVTASREEQERRAALEKSMLAAQKLESLGLLAGGIAHDFNNLLTAIVGNCSMLRMETDENTGADAYLSEIDKIASQAADMCRQLLSYAGQGTIHKRATDVNAVITDTRQLLQMSVNKKTHLVFNLAPGIPAIEADPSQMRQILLNLAINGSDALGSAEGTIRFTTKVLDVDKVRVSNGTASGDVRAGRYVVLEVADSGCGMSKEVRSRIFDPFFTTKQSGRGLGLAAVMGIVRDHAGVVEASSREGMGTIFSIFLPVMGAVEPAAAPVENTVLGEEPWRSHGLALVVDDEMSVQLLGGRMLSAMGFEVLAASDGFEGLMRFNENKDAVRVVLMDINMPKMSGIEVLAEIRRTHPRLPVVLMSGYPHAVDPEALDGHTLFLQKPFRFDTLRDKVRGLVQG